MIFVVLPFSHTHDTTTGCSHPPTNEWHLSKKQRNYELILSLRGSIGMICANTHHPLFQKYCQFLISYHHTSLPFQKTVCVWQSDVDWSSLFSFQEIPTHLISMWITSKAWTQRLTLIVNMKFSTIITALTTTKNKTNISSLL